MLYVERPDYVPLRASGPILSEAGSSQGREGGCSVRPMAQCPTRVLLLRVHLTASDIPRSSYRTPHTVGAKCPRSRRWETQDRNLLWGIETKLRMEAESQRLGMVVGKDVEFQEAWWHFEGIVDGTFLEFAARAGAKVQGSGRLRWCREET